MPAINRWQTVTATEITPDVLTELSHYASEYLIHAADVEGLCKGIDKELVSFLAAHSPIPCTYAGGGKELADIDLVWYGVIVFTLTRGFSHSLFAQCLC